MIIGVFIERPCNFNFKNQMKGLIAILGSGESGKGAAILAKKAGYQVFVSDVKKFQNKQSHYLKTFN